MNDESAAPSNSEAVEASSIPAQVRPMSRRETRLEVCAVLAVAVIPLLANAVLWFGRPMQLPIPTPLDAAALTMLSLCNAFVVAYLIGRSGESWERFGIVPPNTSDVSFGALLSAAALGSWMLMAKLIDALKLPWTELEYEKASSLGDWAVLFPMLFANSVAEEIVTRSYLITRLEQLLSSKTAAVFYSSVSFASYHCYQGAEGVISAMSAGVISGTAFVWTRRLWLVVWAHTFFNLFCYSAWNT